MSEPGPAARPRVALISREHVGHWVPLYVEAFRDACDTITIGPPLDPEGLRFARRERLLPELVPNLIRTEATDLRELLALLPSGWRPDLIVSVQSAAPLENLVAAPCPTVHISVDTWHDRKEFAHARQFDHVFCAQRAFVDYFRAAGVRRAHWLPLAASPRHHFPVDAEPMADLGFVGAVHFIADTVRYVRLQRLGGRFRLLLETALTAEETCNAYALARLAFNSSVSREINMRVFEVLAMGRPLITNRDAEENGLFELFGEGEHLATYAGDEDLDVVIQHYLDHPEEARAMGARGRARVLEAHTYAHRVQTILDTVLGAPCAHPAQLGSADTLVAQLPYGPGRTLDLGGGLERSRIALRRAGVTALDAVLLDTQQARAGSFDAVHAWPLSAPAAAYDTVVCGAPAQFFEDLDAAAAWCARALVPGGVLVLRFADERAAEFGTPEQWAAWAAPHGLHVTDCVAGPAGLDLRLRRYTRSDDELRAEIEARFPLPDPAKYGLPLAEEQPQ